MKPTLPPRRAAPRSSLTTPLLRGLLVVCTLAAAPMAKAQCTAPTLADFGHNSQPVRGQRPLLVVLVDGTDTQITDSRGAAYWEDMLWGRSSFSPGTDPRSVGTMFRAASRGFFNFTRVGSVRVRYPAAFTSITDPGAYDRTVSQLTMQAMVAAGLPAMESFDRNGDGTVDETELTVVRVANTPTARAAAQTRAHAVALTGTTRSFTYAGATVNADQEIDANGIAHELFHSLGFPDHIYGPGATLNQRASFMAASYSAATSPGPIGLDPHHRMRAGWIAPELIKIGSANSRGQVSYGIGSGGLALFYGDTRCTDEFFLAEYRSPNVALGGTAATDSGAFANGVVMWSVKRAPGSFAPYEFNWPPPILGPYVPAIGNHAVANYVLGPAGPGNGSAITNASGEFLPNWGDGSAAGFGIESWYEPASSVGYLGWRATGGRFRAQTDTVNGAAGTTVPLSPALAPIELRGKFPVRPEGLSIRLWNFSRSLPLDIQSFTPERIVVRPRATIPSGTYALLMERDAPRAISTFGVLRVTVP